MQNNVVPLVQEALIKPAVEALVAKKNFFQRLGITPEEFCRVTDENPSIRGVIVGYVAEMKLRNIFAADKRVTGLSKDDDHDRTKKGDLNVGYRGRSFRFECKSLQTNLVKRLGENIWSGIYQCDASDCREITLPNGHKVTTTCLMVGEFDVVAVNLFQFGEKWQFAYALNNDLPRTTHRKYALEDQPYLLKAGPKITLPLVWPYVADPFPLMDLLLAGEKSLPKPV